MKSIYELIREADSQRQARRKRKQASSKMARERTQQVILERVDVDKLIDVIPVETLRILGKRYQRRARKNERRASACFTLAEFKEKAMAEMGSQ